MDKLISRLDLLQEEILNHYENDSKDLEAHIRHWTAVRQDYVTQFYARSKGLCSVGMHPILPMSICQEKAKEAIGMVLTLTSLQNSAYAAEPWTLTETSQEMWRAPPEHTFKKNGSTVKVFFDGNKDNEMQYTNWDKIYYETADGWTVSSGIVDHRGIYYLHDTVKKYFVDFSKEAEKYSQTNEWEVVYQNVTYSPVDFVSSTTPPDGECDRECQHLLGQREGESEGNRDSAPITSFDLGFSLSSGCLRAGAARRRQRQTNNLSLPVPTSASPRAWPRRRRGGGGRGRRAPAAAEEIEEVGERGQEGEENRQRAERPREDPRIPPELQEQRQIGRERRNRRPAAHIPAQQNSDYPLLFLHGPQNSLKCCRYRLLRNYSDLFLNISKCWCWVLGEKANEGRVAVAFNSTSQRQRFMQQVPLPQGITYTWGRISGL